MKRLFHVISTLIVMLFIGGCSSDEFLDDKNLSIDGQKLSLGNGMLNFKDLESFDSVSRYLSNKDSEFLQKWEDSYGIKSIRSVFERAVLEEEIFLENLVKKHGDDPNLIREKIGYSDFTKSKLQSGDLLLDDFGLIDMNITTPSLRSILNEDRKVKIGTKEYQYGMYEIKRIGSNESIAVTRNSSVINSGGRTEYTFVDNSCDNTNGNYRVIGYEEEINFGDGCASYWQRHIKLRSLKKILGTWQNYKTGFMSVTADVKILEWTVSFNGLPSYISRTFVDKTNYTWKPTNIEHTAYWVFVDRVPLACLPAVPTGYAGRTIKHYKRFFTIKGYNSTTCSFGQNPFVYCEAYGDELCHLIGD